MKSNHEIQDIADSVVEAVSRNRPDLIESKTLKQEIRAAIESVLAKSHADLLSPPELAKSWGISPDKVLNWIRSGELQAINVASVQSTRPQYKITQEAIKGFCDRRGNKPKPKPTRRRTSDPNVIQFF